METVRAGGPLAVGSAAWWDGWRERLARRRPRTDGLTIDRIIAAAGAIADGEGLGALTVRRIADKLGTGSATLYRHVASREELLELLVDHVIGEVRLPPPELPGRQRCELLSTELRRVLLDHAALVPPLATSPLLGPNATDRSLHGFQNLLDAGYEPTVAEYAYRSLLHFVLGAVLFQANRADGVGQSAAKRDAVFTFGLRAFLDGLEARHLGR